MCQAVGLFRAPPRGLAWWRGHQIVASRRGVKTKRYCRMICDHAVRVEAWNQLFMFAREVSLCSRAYVPPRGGYVRVPRATTGAVRDYPISVVYYIYMPLHAGVCIYKNRRRGGAWILFGWCLPHAWAACCSSRSIVCKNPFTNRDMPPMCVLSPL